MLCSLYFLLWVWSGNTVELLVKDNPDERPLLFWDYLLGNLSLHISMWMNPRLRTTLLLVLAWSLRWSSNRGSTVVRYLKKKCNSSMFCVFPKNVCGCVSCLRFLTLCLLIFLWCWCRLSDICLIDWLIVVSWSWMWMTVGVMMLSLIECVVEKTQKIKTEIADVKRTMQSEVQIFGVDACILATDKHSTRTMKK